MPGPDIWKKPKIPPNLGHFGPIHVPYPKGLKCWENPCKTIILFNEDIPQRVFVFDVPSQLPRETNSFES